MKLSQIIREYVELKMDGCPQNNGWQSIEDASAVRRGYHERIEELEAAIDAAILAKPGGTET